MSRREELRGSVKQWERGGRGEPTEEQIEAARKVLTADYWRDVRGIVSELARRVLDEGVSSEDVSDAVHELCDGHSRIIYTRDNLETLLVCTNHDAGPEDLGVEGFTDGESINWARLAYAALEHDVRNLADLEGVFEVAEEDEAEDDDEG